MPFQMSLCHSTSYMFKPNLSNSREMCVSDEAVQNSQLGNYSALLRIMALSSVIGVNIVSHHPGNCTNENMEELLNCVSCPRNGACSPDSPSINILFSKYDGYDINQKVYQPDHFVPLFAVLDSRDIDTFSRSLKTENNDSEDKFKVSIDETVFKEINDDKESAGGEVIQNSSETASEKMSELHISKTSEKISKAFTDKKAVKSSAKSQLKITQFASKKRKDDQKTNQEEPTDDENGKVEDSVVTKVGACAVADQERKSTTQVKRKADYSNEAGLPKKGKANTPRYDIGLHYKDIHKMSENQLFDLVQNVWTPEKEYDFPLSTEGKKQRKFQYNWLEAYPWLTYSQYLDGCFCLPCLLFGSRSGHNSSKVIRLVKEPLSYWTSATTRLKEHQCDSQIHRNSTLQLIQFKQLMQNKAQSIDLMLKRTLAAQILRNRQILTSVLKVIVLCGRQNIALRGHRDDSRQILDESSPANTGNFQALLNLIVQSGDKVLEDHFKTAPRNATYRSKTIQNELIKCCGNHILQQLINEIKEAQFFSVLADETQDNSNKEQMPIVLRFVDKNSTIRGKFVEFVHCKDGISGESIAGYITETLERYSLEMKNCRGQGYDGAGNIYVR